MNIIGLTITNRLHCIDELNHLYEIVQPKLIICDVDLIGKVTKSLETLSIDPMICVFANANDKLRSVDEFFMGYDTEPSTFQYLR